MNGSTEQRIPTVYRLDVTMTVRKLAQSREKAKTLIEGGFVYVNGIQAVKPSQTVYDSDIINLTGNLKYVGRGGNKLEKALKVFGIDATGKTALDIGASTGGFTDCLLKHGAKKVYAVDVGQGQLDESLINDPRVLSMEKTDARTLTGAVFGDSLPDIITADVSFISLTKIFPTVRKLAAAECDIILLLKPQFEAGKTKKGIVTSAETHKKVAIAVIDNAAVNGLYCRGFDWSPVKGGDGNIEFLVYFTTDPTLPPCSPDTVAETVKNAHSALKDRK